MQAVAARRREPDIAQTIYSQVGLDPSSVRLAGVRDSVANLQPGDIVAWHGGDRPDGTYTGNMAIYAGNGEIIEHVYGNVRRRALRREDNVYGLPVQMVTMQENPAPSALEGEALSGPEPDPGHSRLPASPEGSP